MTVWSYSGHVLDVGQHLKFEVVSGVSYFATLGDEALGQSGDKESREVRGHSTVITLILSYRKTGRFLYLSSGRGIIDTKFRCALGSG